MKIKTKKPLMLMSSALLLMTLAFSSCKKEEITLSEISPAETEQPGSIVETEKDSVQNQNEAPLDTAELDSAAITEKDSIVPPQVEPPKLEPEQTLPPIGNNAYTVEKALPAGYVKDGSVDYTSYIQNAINNYTELVFPGFPLLVNDTGLKVPSNRIMHFSAGSEIRLKSSSKANYDIFRIENAVNVTLNGPHLIGDRYSHKGTSGEWGHGIGIYSSKNITINDAKIYNCWGDGIYIGTKKHVPNENIKLYKIYCKSNRRAGISVISVKGLQIDQVYAGYSDGTSPYCGINFEPDSYDDELHNIVINDAVTEQNKGNGIQVGFTNLYGKNSKSISIKVTGHKDIGSNYAFKTACRTTKKAGGETITGTVNILNPDWQRNTKQPLYAYSADPNCKLFISKPKVMDIEGVYLLNSETKTVLEDKKSIWSPTIYTLIF